MARLIGAAWPGAVAQPARRPPGAWAREWPLAVLLLILAASVRMLRFWVPLSWPPSDEVNVAVPVAPIPGRDLPRAPRRRRVRRATAGRGGPRYWTGTELLRNSRPERVVTFPAATVRAARIRPAAPAPAWAIAEITAFD